MKKTPTIFERDWNGDKSRVINHPNSECEWVFAGEGIATRKVDGTCCLVRDGVLFKRREIRNMDTPPLGFILEDRDDTTQKYVGWVPVSDAAEDKWHREAFGDGFGFEDGTYELLGPHIQGNPECVNAHVLVLHAHQEWFPAAPRDFDGLRDWLATQDIEGLVFHHIDGRMAKIKKRDFGLKRRAIAETEVK